MTRENADRITVLRRSGQSYATIADDVGLSLNTVKSFCRRNEIQAGTTPLKVMSPPMIAVSDEACCYKNCGKEVPQNPGRKPKIFCSDRCRNDWWNKNRRLVRHKNSRHVPCPVCGKLFEVYGSHKQTYCSHACYIQARFGGADE